MNNLNLQSSVNPTEKISEQEWFIRFNVSTNVYKKQIHVDRHVFDCEIFYDLINSDEPFYNFLYSKPKFSITNILSIFKWLFN
jgi:hypothetical protein